MKPGKNKKTIRNFNQKFFTAYTDYMIINPLVYVAECCIFLATKKVGSFRQGFSHELLRGCKKVSRA